MIFFALSVVVDAYVISDIIEWETYKVILRKFFLRKLFQFVNYMLILFCV